MAQSSAQWNGKASPSSGKIRTVYRAPQSSWTRWAVHGPEPKMTGKTAVHGADVCLRMFQLTTLRLGLLWNPKFCTKWNKYHVPISGSYFKSLVHLLLPNCSDFPIKPSPFFLYFSAQWPSRVLAELTFNVLNRPFLWPIGFNEKEPSLFDSLLLQRTSNKHPFTAGWFTCVTTRLDSSFVLDELKNYNP